MNRRKSGARDRSHHLCHPPLIGISGYATAGKDAIADRLVREHGYVKVAWADKLRAAAMALDPIIGTFPGGPIRYSDVIARYGYNGAKAHPEHGPEVRRTLIRLGTEVGRDIFGADFWINVLLGSLDPAQRYVIADARFPNEADAIISRAGDVWRVNRPGVTAVADHPSEHALAGWDFDEVIYNDGSLSDLFARVDAVMAGTS